MIRTAMTRFGTHYAALSFFDSRFENLKVENGYNVARIGRSISIAAHALNSTEVLAVVDSKQVSHSLPLSERSSSHYRTGVLWETH